MRILIERRAQTNPSNALYVVERDEDRIAFRSGAWDGATEVCVPVSAIDLLIADLKTLKAAT